MNYQAGWSKVKLTPFKTDIVMMGYAHEKNIAKDHATDLHCRILWLQDKSSKQVHINLEIGHISDLIFKELLIAIQKENLNLTCEEIVISANHTHSGPGGINEFLYYEVPTPGRQNDVIDRIISQTIICLKQANSNLSDAKVYFGKKDFPHDWDVAFNRQLGAYAQNFEITNPKDLDPISTIDRTMYQLNIIKENSKAVINWFGVHGTCISNKYNSYHFDNKGYACQYMEEYLGEGSLGIFAQASAGDVTPNNVFDKEMKTTRGSFELEDKNAQKIGNYQYELAKEILKESDHELKTSIKQKSLRVKFPELKNSKFSLGPASFGVSMLEGTKEGPGIPLPLAFVLRIAVRLTSLFHFVLGNKSKKEKIKKLKAAHSKKDIMINASDKQLLGFQIKNHIHLLEFVDPLLKKFNALMKEPEYDKHNTWFSDSSYISVTTWDHIAIVAIPFEVTSMSSKRIKSFIKDKYPQIKDVIINGYSYAYVGYLTTPEEYDFQAYEGGHSVFGKWALPLVLEEIDAGLQELNI